jgi:magnesium transporter
MLVVYESIGEGALRRLEPADSRELGKAIWIDLIEPTRAEQRQVESALKVDLPTRAEMAEIEDSSRFYQDNGALYLTASVMVQSESDFPATTDVSFVFTGSTLVTLRYADPRPFRSFASQAERLPGLGNNAESVLVGLLDACLDRIADLIERASNDLDVLVHEVLTPQERPPRRRGDFDYGRMLRQLERSQTLVAKARISLMSLNRLMNYLVRRALDSPSGKTLREEVLTLIQDVRSLQDHTNYLGNSIAFELQAILGMVSIEQNNIIKIFSVAAVVFIPPTLVASIYGMNFHFMPELRWVVGYPMAVGLMIGSAVLPYLWFKRHGWL